MYLCEKQIKRIIKKIIKGVKHMHKLGIAHRDLKPANIIIGFDHDG
jgi:calcium/calmodulin-dependent protein kinase (CaM kinase) II